MKYRNILIAIVVTGTISVPTMANAGYERVRSSGGWKLYHDPDRNAYLQRVDLIRAEVVMRCSEYLNPPYDCTSELMTTHWDNLKRDPYDRKRALSITNGALFDSRVVGSKAKMSLPVNNSIPNELNAHGYATFTSEFSGHLRALTFETRSASMYPLYYVGLLSNAYNGGIVGTDPDMVVRLTDNIKMGRTVVGITNSKDGSLDTSGNSQKRYLWIHTTYSSTKEEAVDILEAIGVQRSHIAVLDGNGSTQLKTSARWNFYGSIGLGRGPDKRPIPQVMVVRRK